MGRRRSLEDIYLICKYYYPNCTIKQVLFWLVKLLESGDIHACYCYTINKFVFHTMTNSNVFDVYVDFSTMKFNEIYKCVLDNKKYFV